MIKEWYKVDSSELSDLHGSFFAEDIRPGDKINVEIRSLEGLKIEEDLSVWRISPLGIEFLSSKLLDQKSQVGTRLDITVHYPKISIEHNGLVVASIKVEKGRSLIGLRWISPDETKSTTDEKRATKRWVCGDGYLPVGSVPSPVRFNDHIHFKVSDISSSGMLMETSMRNKLLTPGMKLGNVSISFPLIGTANLKCEIKNVRIGRKSGQDILLLGCEFISPDKKLKSQIGQYLLQFGPFADVIELEKNNLSVASLNNALTFTFVKTEKDYREVLALRKRAWVSTGKFTEEVKDEQFSDEVDARSRILVGFYKGRAIASLRIVFTEPGGKLEHEKHLTLPTELPKAYELVEITRVVVDPGFRGKDLLYLLFKNASVTILQSGKRYILGNSEEKLLPLYEKLGMKIMGDLFEVKALNIKAKLFLGDLFAMMGGNGVNPIIWNLLYSELVEYITDYDLFQLSNSDKLRLIGYRFLYPVSKIIENRLINKPKKRRL